MLATYAVGIGLSGLIFIIVFVLPWRNAYGEWDKPLLLTIIDKLFGHQ